jgi:hypothetical protein
MIFKVELHAYAGRKIRDVEIPDDELVFDGTVQSILRQVFMWGQNEMQPRKIPSVSAGDIIAYQGRRYLVRFQGFAEVPLGYQFPGFEEFPKTSLKAVMKTDDLL